MPYEFDRLPAKAVAISDKKGIYRLGSIFLLQMAGNKKFADHHGR